MDGAWKKKKKSSSWQAAIAWKNISQGSKEEHASRIFVNSATQTDSYAILQAANDMQWRCSDLIIETDSLDLVQALRRNETALTSIDSIVKEIKYVANSFRFFSCIKVKIEEVKLAHNLAQQARKG